MRQFLLSALLLAGTATAYAAPGDTTVVQAHLDKQLTYYNDYDTAVMFPDGTKSYRAVYMVFTLGKYACPGYNPNNPGEISQGGTGWCGDWDYTVQTSVMTPAGDTVELGRLITPYANHNVPRTPLSWKQRYTYDVTDYYPLLKNNAAVRIHYSGYSGGFTANIKFIFVEGTPTRNVLGVKSLWRGDFVYGKTPSINDRIAVRNVTIPTGATATELKMLVTGHGSDASQCSEFCSKNYRVVVNGASQANTTIWRSDCGFNQLYPQSGTWIYNRGNWCPGDLVRLNNHGLAGMTGGASGTVDVDFDAHTSTGSNQASYTVSGTTVSYGAFNKQLDAALIDIVAPTNYEGHFRDNPTNGKPIIRVRNTGSTPITSLQIAYGVKDSAVATYTWTGTTLAPLAEAEIVLPELPALRSMSQAGITTASGFTARIAAVNGAADNDIHNDTMKSTFTVAPVWPINFVVNMKTNSAGANGVGTNPSESSWQITDASGAVVASRTDANISTQYTDTVRLSASGMYTLTVSDAGCDGLNWWVWNANPQVGVTSGSFSVQNAATGITIPLSGMISSGTYRSDFGCGFSQSFSVPHDPLGVASQAVAGLSLTASPNPAASSIQLAVSGLQRVQGSLMVYDAVGRLVKQVDLSSSSAVSFPVAGWRAGYYTAIYMDAQTGVRLKTPFVVAP